MRSILLRLGLALSVLPAHALAAAPDPLEVRCDVDRKEFRGDAAGLTANDPVVFRFYDAPVGGSQCGPDHEVTLKSILVFKAKTDRVDGEKPRKFARVEAVIPGQCSGDPTRECQVDSDCPATETCDPPALCPGEETWLELEANNNIEHCNFSAGGRCVGGPLDGIFCNKTSQCQGFTCAAPERRRRVESVPFAQGGTATDLECTDCVCSEEIGPDCITGTHVLDGTICGDDIGPGCITADKLAPAAPKSNVVPFGRTAAAGSGTQIVAGMGFQPSALMVICGYGSNPFASWGFADQDADHAAMVSEGTAPIRFTRDLTRLALINDTLGNRMEMTLTTLDSDGFTIQWTRIGTGFNTDCIAMGFR